MDEASGNALWLALAAGPRISFELPRGLELTLRTDAVLPLAYPRVSVNGVPLMTPGPVAARSIVAIGVRFP
jgi:hypothetical protein